MGKELTLATPPAEAVNGSSSRPRGDFATPGGSLFWKPFLLIAAAAFAVEIPFFFKGNPSGHDFEFHCFSWLEVLAQWKHGIVYPRWAPMAHWAYGEARFLFYPPASWTLGAALARLLPWIIVPSVYLWIALTAAGVSMFLLARQWLPRRDAIFAAILYVVNPYHLVIVYWRSAFAELLASCLLPLLLLFILREEDEGPRVILPLALVIAAAWLTNAPSAIMLHYSLALLVLVAAIFRRSARPLFVAAAAIALAAALAAFYLLPAVYEQKWVQIAEVLAPGDRPAENFLFSKTPDAAHDAFNRLVSLVALSEIVLLAAAIWFSRRWRKTRGLAWRLSLAWAAAAALLMCPLTALCWKFLPELRFVQFPWRWLLCLNVAFALFITLGARRWTTRLALYLATLLVIGFCWQRIQPPWWDNAADLREMQDNMATGLGHDGIDEYVPINADAYEIDKQARRVTVDGPAHAAIRVIDWAPESKVFVAELSGPGQLALRLFNYPAWRVRVNGRDVEAGTNETTGQLLVPVQAGVNRVEINFIRTWDRAAGGWISFATAFLLLLYGFVAKMWKSSAAARIAKAGP